MFVTNRMTSHAEWHFPSDLPFADSSVPRAKLEFVLSAKVMTEPFNYLFIRTLINRVIIHLEVARHVGNPCFQCSFPMTAISGP
jgi:hypothetical protein